MRFAILQQKFLESLEAQNTKAALSILRNELAPLHHDSQRLHTLSRCVWTVSHPLEPVWGIRMLIGTSFGYSWIMCSSPEDLRTKADWDGVAGQSREHLLTNLQRACPSYGPTISCSSAPDVQNTSHRR